MKGPAATATLLHPLTDYDVAIQREKEGSKGDPGCRPTAPTAPAFGQGQEAESGRPAHRKGGRSSSSSRTTWTSERLRKPLPSEPFHHLTGSLSVPLTALDQINPSIHSHWNKVKFQIFGLLKFSALINMV